MRPIVPFARSLKQWDPRPILSRLLRVNRALTIVGLLGLATLVATLAGLLLDPRVITGAPAWLKPTKFAISGSVYAFTLVWLLGFVRGHRRPVALVANVTAVALTVEVALIIVQVVRGTTSHFNFSTPLDGAIFSTMGAFIVAVWLAGLVTGGLLFLQQLPDAPLGWSLRMGVVIALVGMGVGLLMTQPTPDQVTTLAAGASGGGRIVGAHSVGVPDAGPGLPLVGWSTVGGDLRVAHFVGLHALQVLPLVGWWLSRSRVTRIGLSERHRLALVGTVGLAYLGAVVLLAWQALRGQSLVAPDGATMAAFGSLFGLVALVVVAVLGHARRTRHAPPYASAAAAW
jgi:hypothetical protein